MPGPIDGRAKRAGEAEQRAERDRQIWQMRIDAWSELDIARHFGITQQRVSVILKRVMSQLAEPVAEELRRVELAKYDQAERAVLEVLRAKHVHVTAAGVALQRVPGTGEWDEAARDWIGAEWTEIIDDAPVLAAVDRLLKVSKARREVTGMDAPTRAEVTTYDYRINGVDMEALR